MSISFNQFKCLLLIVMLLLLTNSAYAFGFRAKKNISKEPDTISVVNEQSLFHYEEPELTEIDEQTIISEPDLFGTFDLTMPDSIPTDSASLTPRDFDIMLENMMQSWVVEQGAQSECGNDTFPVVVSDSLYMLRLAMLPHVIEMPYNNVVRSLIEFYTVKKKGQLEYMLGVSKYYFPLFEEVLEANGLPLELKYLPVIESALNTRAVSSMGAAGLWQFMIATGRVYNLEINSLIDERLDPVKSTHAAAQFLKELYGLYGDWHLAIAAYNCGPGNVNKAIRRSGGKRDFWEIYPYLPRETRGYVPIFIAANYAMNYADQHNICPAQVEMPIVTDTIMISDRIHLEQVASVLNVSIDELRTLNPQYRRDIIPGDVKPYSLCLPMSHISACLENYDDILLYKADELVNNRRKEVEIHQASAPGGTGKMVYYKVRSGDTLSGIAKKYGVSVTKLRNWNGISGSKIYAGQRLKVYN